MPISIQQISYIHPDKEALFSDLNFAISKGQKLVLVGINGCGKSTLLQIIAGQWAPSSGVIDVYKRQGMASSSICLLPKKLVVVPAARTR